MAINKPITLSQLHKRCEELLLQHGDKYIFITDDEEWNGIHAAWYNLDLEVIPQDEEYQENCRRDGCDPKDCVLLW